MSAWSEGKDAELEEEENSDEEQVVAKPEAPQEVPETPAPLVPSSPPVQAGVEDRWASDMPEMTFDQFDRAMGSLHANDSVSPANGKKLCFFFTFIVGNVDIA